MLTNRLRELRIARGESLREVAEAVGIDHGHLSKVERNQVGCSDIWRLALAEHFDVGISDLFFQRSVESHETNQPVEVVR